MKAVIFTLALAWASTIVAAEAPGDQPNPGSPAPVTQATIDKLLAVIAAHEARIEDLERKLGDAGSGVPETPPRPAIAAISPPVAAAAVVAPELPAVPAVPAQPVQDHDIMMTIPGGPQLHIRGFAELQPRIRPGRQSADLPPGPPGAHLI